MVRHGSEHCLLSRSVTAADFPSKLPNRELQHFNRSSSPLRRKSLTLTAQSSKDKKSKNLEKNHFRSKKNKKKSETFNGRGTPPSSAHSSPAKSATMYFGGSPSHPSNLTNSVSVGGAGGGALSCSSTFSGIDCGSKSSKKSRWTMLRSKMGKKFTRASNVDEEESNTLGRLRTQRSHSSASIKKYNIDRTMSITEEDSRSDYLDGGSMSGSNPRLRRSSSSHQGYNLKMLSKIFSILTCWVDEYFEVSSVIYNVFF